jgi:hypothetical protein
MARPDDVARSVAAGRWLAKVRAGPETRGRFVLRAGDLESRVVLGQLLKRRYLWEKCQHLASPAVVGHNMS